ncbi:two pore domain potassium channel family protein [Altererythrobacter oceanensis]|uniref:Two pore domain potassium channel family protein n=2 Tax=Qipengyuania oceanensis TaxID=1463597 RepID=A0A844YI23_9SPHN|nr:two pore domain potassium channel family protein [Qipengyuania oceanensis]
MATELLIATVMVLLTVGFHGFGLIGLQRVLRIERRDEHAEHTGALSARGITATFMLVLGLFVLHGIEIWTYALLYLGLDALPDLRTAVYFSTITYSTIGYDDEGIAQAWSLIAAIEGINGILLMGWSTAYFVSIMGRLGR